MAELSWSKAENGQWHALRKLDRSRLPSSTGIYVIWHAGNPSRVVMVGQGNIADRLTYHRNESTVMDFESNGQLYVTWAEAPPHLLDGFERFLTQRWNPLAGSFAYLDAQPVAVNSPF